MFTAIDWFKSNLYLYIIGAILVVIFFVLVWFIALALTKKGKFTKKYNQARKDYLEITKLPISDALSKLESLAMRNGAFSKLLADFTNRFLNYNDNYLQAINNKLEEFKKLINDESYSQAQTAYSGLIIMLETFRKEYQKLYVEICESTAEEEVLEKSINNLKSEYSHCQKLYANRSNDLEVVAAKIKGLFRRIETMIEEGEENLLAGMYLETADLIKQIRTDLEYLGTYLNNMPDLIRQTSGGIVRELNELIAKNNLMQSEEYPLYHLMPIKKVEDLKVRVNESFNRIKEFDCDGLEIHLEQLQRDIHQLSVELDDERRARKEYDEGCENLYVISDCTNRNYSKVIKEVEKLQEMYASTPEFDEFKRISKQYHDQLSEARKKVDNNVYDHQPYTMRLKNMGNLKKLSEDFQMHLDGFSVLAEQMRNAAEHSFNNIDGYIALIKKTKLIVANCNVANFTKRYDEKIKTCEDYLSSLMNALKVPLKLTLAKELVAKLNKECKELYGSAVYQEKLMNYCERIIVLASKQRMGFQIVESGVSKATFYFNEGDFESARYTIEKLVAYNIPLPSFEENVQMVK